MKTEFDPQTKLEYLNSLKIFESISHRIFEINIDLSIINKELKKAKKLESSYNYSFGYWDGRKEAIDSEKAILERILDGTYLKEENQDGNN